MAIKFDSSDFLGKIAGYSLLVQARMKQATEDVANEALRLSSNEVPIYTPFLTSSKSDHTGGDLQDSGHVENGDDDYEKLVGYNTVYAAYQHEGDWPDGSHVIRQHSNPRGKTKYLENPISQNLDAFKQFFQNAINL